MIGEDSRSFRVLHKFLHRISRDEGSIRLRYTPIQFAIERAWRSGFWVCRRALEEVFLAIKCIEGWIQARDDEPPAIKDSRIEFLDKRVITGFRIFALVRSTGHAALVTHCARIEPIHSLCMTNEHIRARVRVVGLCMCALERTYIERNVRVYEFASMNWNDSFTHMTPTQLHTQEGEKEEERALRPYGIHVCIRTLSAYKSEHRT